MDDLLAYAPLVRAMVRRYQGPGLEGEDLAQEAWLALLIAQRDYRPYLGTPRQAFYKSRVRAALADCLRNYRRDALCWRWNGPVELFAKSSEELGDEIGHLLLGLSVRQRQVLAMYYGKDLPLREIARRLGLSLTAVHTHKQRGLAALRRLSCSIK